MIANIAYAARMTERPCYHANDASRDVLEINVQPMRLVDGRAESPSLDVQGFCIVDHPCDVTIPNVHAESIVELLTRQTGADAVRVTAPGVQRFSEKSPMVGTLNNSRPARFAHVDVSDATAAIFADRSKPEGRTIARSAHYNIWRCLTPPPQDVPLAVCDARSVKSDDLILADAVFDEVGKPDWSFEGIVVAHNPAHRWHWFANMHDREALIFKTHDSNRQFAHCVPHVAFDDPNCPIDAPARNSIEMRAIAYWFA